MLLSSNLQYRMIAMLQVGRYEYWEIASSNVGILLSCKLQDKNIVKLQVAIQENW